MSKIARVVLYKHGMACFERKARVNGDATVHLNFRHEEMDDALKSLAVVDHGGGQLASVAYDPHPLLAAHLDDIKIELPHGGGMLALVGQLIGAEVILHMGADRLQGRILGTEKVEEARDRAVIQIDMISLIVDGALTRARLSEVDRVEPVDEALGRDLAVLLQRLDSRRRASRRRVTLDLRGEGERDLWLSYTVPSTVWKTSYRVVFDDEGGGQPTVLGFALVDNDSPDDWQDVALSLVAGLPISFTHDLYSPRRRERPHVRVETEAPIAPPIIEGAVITQKPEVLFDVMGDMLESTRGPTRSAPATLAAFAAPPPPGAPPPQGGGYGGAPAPATRSMAQSTRVETRTQEVGDQFRYDVMTPVSIKSGRSALVPILSDKLEGEIVAVYNERVRAGNPLTAFKMKNTSGLTLEGGPATVFRSGEYVGEAMFDTMRPDEERLVPFSVELGCRITTAFETSTEAQQRFEVKRGSLVHTTWSRQQTTYTIRNISRRPLKIYLDHAADRQATYVDTPDPAERTETFDRFIVEVAAGQQAAFPVTQRRQHGQSVWITPEQIDNLLQRITNVGPRPALTEALTPLLETSRLIASMNHELAQIQKESAEITQQHARIRENLKTLGQDNKKERDLRERYVTALDADETRLNELQSRAQTLTRSVEEHRAWFQQQAAALDLH